MAKDQTDLTSIEAIGTAWRDGRDYCIVVAFKPLQPFNRRWRAPTRNCLRPGDLG